jgi:hypothetical protein
MFTQSLLTDEHTSPLRRKLELGFTVYSISAVFLYILPALLLWKTYQGLVQRLCSLLATVGSESVRQMQPPAADPRNRTLLVLMGVSIVYLGSACTGRWSPLGRSRSRVAVGDIQITRFRYKS